MGFGINGILYGSVQLEGIRIMAPTLRLYAIDKRTMPNL